MSFGFYPAEQQKNQHKQPKTCIGRNSLAQIIIIHKMYNSAASAKHVRRTKSDSGLRSRAGPEKNVKHPTTTEHKQSSPRIEKYPRAKHPKQNEWTTQMGKANVAWGKKLSRNRIEPKKKRQAKFIKIITTIIHISEWNRGCAVITLHYALFDLHEKKSWFQYTQFPWLH